MSFFTHGRGWSSWSVVGVPWVSTVSGDLLGAGAGAGGAFFGAGGRLGGAMGALANRLLNGRTR